MNELTLQVKVNDDKLNNFINEHKELLSKYDMPITYWSHDTKRNELILSIPLNKLITIEIVPLKKHIVDKSDNSVTYSYDMSEDKDNYPI